MTFQLHWGGAAVHTAYLHAGHTLAMAARRLEYFRSEVVTGIQYKATMVYTSL